MVRFGITILYIVFLFPYSFSQTCCSGGVPLSSNLGLPPSFKNTLQISLSYDLNVLETLKTGTETLDDDSRNRTTHSTLLNLGYSFTDRFSIDAFFSFVRQERTITQFGNVNKTFTQGIGDAAFLLKYKILSLNNNNTTFTGALGIKLPFGSTTETNNGIPLNADLQPGSGAIDGILWGQFSHVASFRPSMSFSLTGIYGIKGVNDNYLPFTNSEGFSDAQTYQFGNELQLLLGISDRILVGNNIIDPSLTFKYRHVQPDRNTPNRAQELQVNVPSTGGNWIFIRPALTFWFNDNFSVNTRIELPLRANITGTQVTPTYRFSIGIYHKFQFGKKQTLILPNQ